MSDSKMLQIIVDGLSGLREDLKSLERKVDSGFGVVNKRLDNLGLEIAELADDAPTNDEHKKLEKRVTKLEKPPFQTI